MFTSSSRLSANARALADDGIQPLDVVDRDQDRLAIGEKLQRASGRQRPGCGSRPAPVRRPGSAARSRAREAAGRRQLGRDVDKRVVEQVSQPGVATPSSTSAGREDRTRSPRSRAASTRRARASTCRSRPRPPGRAPPGPRSLPAEEAVERPQLLVATDDFDCHLLPVIVTRSGEKSALRACTLEHRMSGQRHAHGDRNESAASTTYHPRRETPTLAVRRARAGREPR